MKELSQIQRLLRILQILSSGRKVTTKELYQRFKREASLRTLQRDLLALSEAGIPLITEKTIANENAWLLSSQFRSFIPLPLETNEYLAAHILKANLNIFQKTPFGEEINSLIKKIDQIVPEDIFLDVDNENASKIFENYSAGIFDYAPYGDIINNLITSILHRNVCEVFYYNIYKNEQKKYPIEPVKFVFYNGGLYIIAFIRKYKKFRLFAIQRIKKLIIKNKKYVIEQNFDPELFWKNKFGLFSAEPVDVRLKFSKDISHHIVNRKWHHSQKLINHKNGDIILSMKVGISPELISWVISWHRYVIVKSPQPLIDIIKSTHSSALKQYN